MAHEDRDADQQGQQKHDFEQHGFLRFVLEPGFLRPDRQLYRCWLMPSLTAVLPWLIARLAGFAGCC